MLMLRSSPAKTTIVCFVMVYRRLSSFIGVDDLVIAYNRGHFLWIRGSREKSSRSRAFLCSSEEIGRYVIGTKSTSKTYIANLENFRGPQKLRFSLHNSNCKREGMTLCTSHGASNGDQT